MTGLTLLLSGDLFDPPAEAIVGNLLIGAAVHESGFALNSLPELSPIEPLSEAKQTPLLQPPGIAITFA